MSDLRNDLRIPSDEEAASLARAVAVTAGGESPPSSSPFEAFIVLSRWARHLSIHRHTSAAQEHTLLVATTAALRILRGGGGVSDVVTSTFPTTAAAVLYLGNAANALPSVHLREEIAEAVGNLLLHFPSQQQQHNFSAFDSISLLISGSVTLLPALVYHPDAACWVFTAMLHALETLPVHVKNTTTSSNTDRVLRILVQIQPAVRTATVSLASAAAAAPRQPQTRTAPRTISSGYQCLEGMYGVLRAVLLPFHPLRNNIPANDTMQKEDDECRNLNVVAGAALAAGGLLQGLVRNAPPPSTAMMHRTSLQSLIEATSELLLCAANVDDVTVRAATALALGQCYHSCRLPKPTPATLSCCISGLFDTLLDIQPLLRALNDSSKISAAAASAALAQQAASQQQHQQRHISQLMSVVMAQLAELLQSLCAEERTKMLESIRTAAFRTHQQYRQYILHDWTPFTSSIDHLPLQSALETLFSTSIDLVSAFHRHHHHHHHQSGGSTYAAAAVPAALVLSIAADLQFCRTNTPHYAPLLKTALLELPLLPHCITTSSYNNSVNLADCCPLYTALQSPLPAHGNVPAWLIDSLSAAKMQLLFTALAPCCAQLPEEVCLNRVTPLAMLYLLHPHDATSSAAHRFLWSLMAVQPQYAHQLAPFYTTRCLEGVVVVGVLPHDETSGRTFDSSNNVVIQRDGSVNVVMVENLSQGLSTALAAMSAASPVAVLCVKCVLGKCRELAVAGPCWDDACLVIFKVALQQVLTVHYALVGDVVELIEEFICEAPERLKAQLCGEILSVIVSTEDCVRKPVLTSWYQRYSAVSSSSCL